MSEWWTYRLSNFLLFSPRTYYRLFELYNAAIWPAQAAAFLLGLVILYCLLRPTPARSRLAFGILAACWSWVAIAFQLKRYATINFAAVQFAWAFIAEAALLLVVPPVILRKAKRPKDLLDRAALSEPGHDRAGGASPSPATRSAGAWFFGYALLLHPLAGFLTGRGWRGMELFGVAPDPTAIATIGAVLLAKRGRRWPLLVIPVLWCVVSAFTLRAMKAPDGWILFGVAAAAVVLSLRRH